MKLTLENLIPPEADQELVDHLRNLIRIDTTNPPGNEIEAARYIEDVFNDEGIQSSILEPSPGRGNLVARIEGDGSKRPLLLMSHLDVVAAELEKWIHPPFNAEIHDGSVWGRGALDCKNTVSLWMMVMLLLKRSGLVPKRDVIFLATADEEAGHQSGMEWLVKNHYNLIDAEAALNEGGGFAFEFMGNTYFNYQSAEKGNIWLRITAQGTPGHASIPLPDNPVKQIAALTHRLAKTRFPVCVTHSVKQMFKTMASSLSFPKNRILEQLNNPYLSKAVVRLAIRDSEMAATISAMLSNSISPTVLKAGSKVNVIPSQASCEIDYRILPGYDKDEAILNLKKRIGKKFKVAVLDARPASESTLDHDLVRSIQKVLKNQQPEAAVVPLMSTGSTDASFLRPKGVAVYGFSPMLPKEDFTLVHGHNERISLDSLTFSLKVGMDVVMDYIL